MHQAKTLIPPYPIPNSLNKMVHFVEDLKSIILEIVFKV
jgi:hypothetical protein